MRKIILLIIILVILFILMGCNNTDDLTNSGSEPIKTVEASAEPELTPEPTIDPAMQEKLKIAPKISGLEKEIVEKDGILKIIYVYSETNIYGGIEGEYAGEFKQEVTFTDPESNETTEVGGLALKPEVVKWWIELMNSNGCMKYGAESVYCPIPIDISGMNSYEVNVSYNAINENGTGGVFNNLMDQGEFDGISVKYEGYLPLVCISLGREDVDSEYIVCNQEEDKCLIEGMIYNYMLCKEKDPSHDYNCSNILFNVETYYNEDNIKVISTGQDLSLIFRYVYYMGEFKFEEEPPTNYIGKFIYGDRLCDVASGVIYRIYDFEEYLSILTIDDFLVFICGNDS